VATSTLAALVHDLLPRGTTHHLADDERLLRNVMIGLCMQMRSEACFLPAVPEDVQRTLSKMREWVCFYQGIPVQAVQPAVSPNEAVQTFLNLFEDYEKRVAMVSGTVPRLVAAFEKLNVDSLANATKKENSILVHDALPMQTTLEAAIRIGTNDRVALRTDQQNTKGQNDTGNTSTSTINPSDVRPARFSSSRFVSVPTNGLGIDAIDANKPEHVVHMSKAAAAAGLGIDERYF
jgi:hypothetical protein